MLTHHQKTLFVKNWTKQVGILLKGRATFPLLSPTENIFKCSNWSDHFTLFCKTCFSISESENAFIITESSSHHMLTKESGTRLLWMNASEYLLTFCCKIEARGGKIGWKRAVDFLLWSKLVVFPWSSGSSRETPSSPKWTLFLSMGKTPHYQSIGENKTTLDSGHIECIPMLN